MNRKISILAATIASAAILASQPAVAQRKSAQQTRAEKTQEIPICTRKLGTIAIVEPDNQWWREFNLGSPEAIIKVFVQKSGCFSLVNRGRAMASRAMERAMASHPAGCGVMAASAAPARHGRSQRALSAFRG